MSRTNFRGYALAVLLCVFPAIAAAILPDAPRTKEPAAASAAPNLDVRVNGVSGLTAAAAARPVASAMLQGKPNAAVLDAAQARTQAALAFKSRVAASTIEFSPATLAPENVLSDAGPLTGPSSAPSFDIAKDYLRSERALYGLSDAEIDALELLGESLSPTGLRMLRVRQVFNGRPVFLSETRILLDAEGRVLRTLGSLVPDLSTSVEADSNLISASAALVSAMSSVGIVLDAAQIYEPLAQGVPPGVGTIVVDDLKISKEVTSALVYFPLLPGTVIPAWQQVTFTNGSAAYTTVVDAVTGTVLWRKNIQSHASTQDARFSVYVQADGTTPTSPAPHAPTTQVPGAHTQFPAIARSIVSMFAAQNTTASPNGWITDGGTSTTGNNVDAYLDTNADNTPDTGLLDNVGRPTGNPDAAARNRDFLGAAPRDYTYNPPPLISNPDAGDAVTTPQSRRGAVTNLFYLSNWYHDKLYALGFNEAAGNFQTNNFGKGGTGNDPVLAEVQDGSGTNNANFSTPPDGTSGRMQMYVFPGPTPARDGSLDPDIVLHELTHGTSNRLIGNGNGLLWDIGGGMGEGWSDFYALSLQHNSAADDPDGEYGSGAWTVYKLGGLLDNYLYGIRGFPYSTNNSINPLTWADADDVTHNESGGITPSPLNFAGNGSGEVHNIGVIWANTLWEVRSRIIAANGASVPTGNGKTLQIVTDALKLTPANPSYLQARNALISSDCAANACANEDSIWGGFADRGLGYGAIAPLGQSGVDGRNAYTGIKESFVLPHLDVQSVSINDSLGNNNGRIEPGEPIRLTPTMLNPWRAASKNMTSAVAVLSTSTPGVTVIQNTSIVGAVAAQGTLAGSPFLISVGAAALCGQSLDFTVAITSQPGNVVSTSTFKIRVGASSGTDAPITYTKTIAGGLAIPDNNLLGVTSTLSIADDIDINNIKFRLDSLTHTWVGDIVVGLKGPTGYGATMIFHPGVYFGTGAGNSGDNFTNTVIDDASSNDIDLLASAAPFTGTWKTAFNSPVFNMFTGYFPDPVGQLSRFNSSSAKGNWTVFAADWAAGDVGTLNSWSVIITPTHYACAAFTPVPLVTGTKTVSGTFTPGGAITYTVVLTNIGGAAQGDNPGHEFTDVLPSSLTLNGASSTSGTAATSGNTVTWDGSIAAAGSVTITIQATIKAATSGGTIVSNQGTVSYDGDGNGTNEASALTDDPTTGTANDPTSFTVTGGASAPVLQSVVLRRMHGGLGPFDITLSSVLINPSTEPRIGPTHQMIFTYNKPLNAANAAVTEGVATPSPSIVGSTVVVDLTGVNDQQYVTVTLTNVGSTDGGTGGTGVARAGFLMGDVNQNRVVTVSDVGLTNAQVAVPVTISNFLMDINANGALTVSDKGLANSAVTHALPAP